MNRKTFIIECPICEKGMYNHYFSSHILDNHRKEVYAELKLHGSYLVDSVLSRGAHKERLKCDACEKRFDQKIDLTRHISDCIKKHSNLL